MARLTSQIALGSHSLLKLELQEGRLVHPELNGFWEFKF